MSDGNSFSLLDQLVDITFDVIFVTASNEFAIRAIRLGAIDYILKPVDDEEIASAIDRIRLNVKRSAKSMLFQQLQTIRKSLRGSVGQLVLRTQESIYFVSIADILYCQSDGNYTTFFLSDQRRILVSKPIKEYEQILPTPLFIRTHQSYLVNRKWVERLRKDESVLILKSGTKVPVSSRRREEVISLLTAN